MPGSFQTQRHAQFKKAKTAKGGEGWRGGEDKKTSMGNTKRVIADMGLAICVFIDITRHKREGRTPAPYDD